MTQKWFNKKNVDFLILTMLAIVTNTRQISESLKNVMHSGHHLSFFPQGYAILFISVLIDTLFTSLRRSGRRKIVGFFTCLKVSLIDNFHLLICINDQFSKGCVFQENLKNDL